MNRCIALVALVSVLGVGASCLAADKLERLQIQHGGVAREYLIAVPPTYQAGKPVPLVFALHGGRGTADQVARFMRFHVLGRRKGFITVYPQGLNNQWNDDRPEIGNDTDDVGFLLALLDHLRRTYTIDPNATFAMGMSNGGFMCQRLAREAADRFAAVASVTAQLPEAARKDFAPKAPISVLIMNGTKDPLVPYEGGDVKVNLFPGVIADARVRSRGRILSTDATVALWRKHNGLRAQPERTEVPDRNKDDGVKASVFTWSQPDRVAAVVLYRVEGGGHTYPGGVQYLPERLIGKTCGDFDATVAIWEFFDTHRGPQADAR